MNSKEISSTFFCKKKDIWRKFINNVCCLYMISIEIRKAIFNHIFLRSSPTKSTGRQSPRSTPEKISTINLGVWAQSRPQDPLTMWGGLDQGLPMEIAGLCPTEAPLLGLARKTLSTVSDWPPVQLHTSQEGPADQETKLVGMKWMDRMKARTHSRKF